MDDDKTSGISVLVLLQEALDRSRSHGEVSEKSASEKLMDSQFSPPEWAKVLSSKKANANG